jgi:hypothetical protein
VVGITCPLVVVDQRDDHTLTRQKCISSPPSIGLQERARDGFIPGVFNQLSYTNLIALLVVGLLIQKVNVVLFLVLISVVPESARLSMILVGQCMLQLVSVGKLLPVQLILEIRCQTCKS